MRNRSRSCGQAVRETLLAGCWSIAGAAAVVGTARASEFRLTDPACEAGCAPVVECADVGCSDGSCHDLSCHAVGGHGCAGRQTLLGDVGGLRSGLAESGVTVDLDLTQIYQGVATGGEEQTGAYGGHSDLLLNFDFSKMGGPRGLFLKIRGEGNFGESITEPAGVLLPPAIQTELPVSGERTYAVTNFLFTQALSESFAVFAGKMDSLDGDLNAFAHGRGKTGFMNSAFVVNPVGLRTIPYSTLATGFSILSGAEPIFTFAAWNPTDTSTTSGFDELYEEGVTLSSELRLPTRFFDRPGHQLFAATWSSRDFVALEQDPRVLLPILGLPGTPIAQAGGSWSAYWNMDQYLVVDPNDETRGWGFFARYGAADPETSPLAHFASAGLGGSSLLPSRKADTWGIGYYYAWVGDNFVTNVLQLDDGQGIEMYYRAMLTPYFDVTPDLQVLDGSLPNEEEWALLLGVRANLRF